MWPSTLRSAGPANHGPPVGVASCTGPSSVGPVAPGTRLLDRGNPLRILDRLRPLDLDVRGPTGGLGEQEVYHHLADDHQLAGAIPGDLTLSDEVTQKVTGHVVRGLVQLADGRRGERGPDHPGGVGPGRILVGDDRIGVLLAGRNFEYVVLFRLGPVPESIFGSLLRGRSTLRCSVTHSRLGLLPIVDLETRGLTPTVSMWYD